MSLLRNFVRGHMLSSVDGSSAATFEFDPDLMHRTLPCDLVAVRMALTAERGSAPRSRVRLAACKTGRGADAISGDADRFPVATAAPRRYAVRAGTPALARVAGGGSQAGGPGQWPAVRCFLRAPRPRRA